MKNSDKKVKRERSRSQEKSPTVQDQRGAEEKKKEERRKKFGTTIGNNSRIERYHTV